MADGSTSACLGMAKGVPVSFEGQQIKLDCLVIRELPFGMIIGCPTMEELETHIDLGNNSVSIRVNGNRLQLPLDYDKERLREEIAGTNSKDFTSADESDMTSTDEEDRMETWENKTFPQFLFQTYYSEAEAALVATERMSGVPERSSATFAQDGSLSQNEDSESRLVPNPSNHINAPAEAESSSTECASTESEVDDSSNDSQENASSSEQGDGSGPEAGPAQQSNPPTLCSERNGEKDTREEENWYGEEESEQGAAK